ncbi:arsenic resistance N-acetyltransferase ArsN2 [Rhizobium leguminosarum]|uniref:arsenic resistance N-acetyltransferase ArsN2 n=1 Tax=Rhizobium leguminosarum TaxID=384 RepID=UPI00144210AA|nr:arsenic resistance N-acetyltransferase ArsN2 [Rhizobium leguminosarum]MBY3026643.1 GNAT family N-acetyltransferase [Rhizobium leguminosarum]NKL74083.1 GNAT family N-acetyltransferase [Rhizobium leguminosarum bv. viciae]
MISVRLESIAGDISDLTKALSLSGLPTEDVAEPGRTFFRAVALDNNTVGYSGVEQCGEDALLRSVVVLPDHRGKSYGKMIVAETLRAAPVAGNVYLATTTAAPFFSNLGFEAVHRADVPDAILATRQLSGICPASASIMKLTKPPT